MRAAGVTAADADALTDASAAVPLTSSHPVQSPASFTTAMSGSSGDQHLVHQLEKLVAKAKEIVSDKNNLPANMRVPLDGDRAQPHINQLSAILTSNADLTAKEKKRADIVKGVLLSLSVLSDEEKSQALRQLSKELLPDQQPVAASAATATPTKRDKVAAAAAPPENRSPNPRSAALFRRAAPGKGPAAKKKAVTKKPASQKKQQRQPDDDETDEDATQPLSQSPEKEWF